MWRRCSALRYCSNFLSIPFSLRTLGGLQSVNEVGIALEFCRRTRQFDESAELSPQSPVGVGQAPISVWLPSLRSSKMWWKGNTSVKLIMREAPVAEHTRG